MNKKVFIIAIIFACCTLGVQAMSVSNPLFMPKKGGLMSDTVFAFSNTTAGDSNKIYSVTEALSYNLTNRLQLGGYIGYATVDVLNEKDLTNPGVFAYFRVLDNIIKLDIGGDINFNVFDKINEGGINDGIYKYTAIARLGVDLAALSFGAIGNLSYWRGDDVKAYTINDHNNIINGDIKAFAIFDILDIVGVGGEVGYKAFDINRDAKDKGYYLTGRVDINPIPSRLGVKAFITFEDMQNQRENYTLGAQLRVVI